MMNKSHYIFSTKGMHACIENTFKNVSSNEETIENGKEEVKCKQVMERKKGQGGKWEESEFRRK